MGYENKGCRTARTVLRFGNTPIGAHVFSAQIESGFARPTKDLPSRPFTLP